MISQIMRRFLGKENGVSIEQIANGLITKATSVCYAFVSRNILKNLNSDLNEASDQMNKVVKTCSSRATNLSSKCSPALNSISKCVSEMLNMSEKRDLEKSAKRCCLEQKKQEVRMRELSSLAFQEGIKEIDKSMRCVQQGMLVLNEYEFAGGESAMMKDEFNKTKPRKRGRESDDDEFNETETRKRGRESDDDEFNETETRKRGRKSDAFEFEDDSSFL
jgi:hypothetical protein